MLKKLFLTAFVLALILSGCATRSDFTPELMAEIDAVTPDTVTLYFAPVEIPDTFNYDIMAAIITTNADDIQAIQEKNFAANTLGLAASNAVFDNLIGTTALVIKEAATMIVYKTEVNPNIGAFTGEFGISACTFALSSGYRSTTTYLYQDTFLINKKPGTYYYALACFRDKKEGLTFAFQEVTAEFWAEMIEPKVKAYGNIGKSADPNFVRPPKKN